MYVSKITSHCTRRVPNELQEPILTISQQPRGSRRASRPTTSSSRSAARSTSTPWCLRTPTRPRSLSSPFPPVCAPSDPPTTSPLDGKISTGNLVTDFCAPHRPATHRRLQEDQEVCLRRWFDTGYSGCGRIHMHEWASRDTLHFIMCSERRILG